MKISFDQLPAHLERGLAPVYLISGDEVLFVQEACAAIKAAASKANFSEQLRFHVDSSFDWQLFQSANQSGSLFSDKQLIELQVSSTKFNDAAKEVLLKSIERLSASKILLIHTSKLDAAVQKTLWFKAIDKVGVTLPIWPLQPQQLIPWLVRRLQAHGIQVEPAGVELLAACTQGNLLAAKQEIEKLALLYAQRFPLTLEQIRVAISVNARYDVFHLADTVLQGDPLIILRVLAGLREEAAEPTLILWALTRELRQLLPLMQAVNNGQSIAQVVSSPAVWDKRKPWVGRTLKLHSLTSLQQALQQAGRIDRIIKGAATGNVWDEINTLALTTAGVKLPPSMLGAV